MNRREFFLRERQKAKDYCQQVEADNGRAFARALSVLRCYPGMPDLKMSYRPYRCYWLVEGSYSDGTNYQAKNDSASVALRALAQMVRRCPPRVGLD